MKKVFKCFSLLLLLFVLTPVVNAIEVADEASLKTALTNGETEITLANDIVLSNDVHTHAVRTVGLEVKGEGTITIDGAGHKLSSALVVAIELRANDGKEVKVVFKNIEIAGTERAIDIRSKNVTLELDDADVSVTKYGNYQAITAGGPEGPITINIINNSVVNGGEVGYGIVTFNPVNMTIKDSVVKGYAALYFKPADSSEGSAGSVVNVIKSSLEGISKSSGDSDHFGTVVFEDKDIKINLVDTVIKATNEGTATQTPFVIGDNVLTGTEDEKIEVSVEGNSEIIVDNQIDDENVVMNYSKDAMDVVIKADVKSNIELSEEYLEEGAELTTDKDGNVVVVKRHAINLGTITNGTVKVDKENAIAGEIVTIEAAADKDYTLQNIEVVDADGNKVEVKDGKFVMPDSEISVKITFIEVKSPETSDINILLVSSALLIGIAGLVFILKKKHN